MPDNQSLSGRGALVTGGARRVGKAIAMEFARRGARVAIHANSSIAQAEQIAERLTADFGVESFALQANLDNESAATGLIDQVIERFGEIDLLAHSAAIWPKKPLEESDASDLRDCLEVNTVATFVLARHAGLRMAEQDSGGAITLMGDAATGHDGTPYPGYAAYHPTKAALPGMTRALAVELAERNPLVRVNLVLPGPVICEHLPDEPVEPDDRKAHTIDAALTHTPDPGGYGRAEHVAHAVAFVSENPFVNAVSLPVDGGGRLK